MSSAIADYIIEVKEWGLLNLILTKACSLLEKEDAEQIRSMIRSLLNDDGPRGRLKRQGKLTTLLEKDFKELRVINLEGLIQFRLHAYKKELEEIVDYAMEEFWADRQYEEFMGLLKYFVFFRKAKFRSYTYFTKADIILRFWIVPWCPYRFLMQMTSLSRCQALNWKWRSRIES